MTSPKLAQVSTSARAGATRGKPLAEVLNMSAMRATLAPNEQAFHRKMTKKFKPYNDTRDITLKAKHLEIELTDQIAQV